MPVAKHRRQGKARASSNVIVAAAWLLSTFSTDEEDVKEGDIILARMRELYGDRDDWTDQECDDAVDALIAEGKVRPYAEW